MGQIDNDILNLFAAVKEFKLFHFGHLTPGCGIFFLFTEVEKDWREN